MHTLLFSVLESISPLSESLKASLLETLVVKEFRKKSCLLKDGQICNHIYFIEKGLVKSYYVKDGSEICSWFMKENDLIISVKSFFTRQPGYETIQAVEDTTVHYIHYQDLQKIYQTHIEFNIIGRILTEKYYVLSEERLFAMRKQSAEEKFNFLLKHQPEIVQRVARKDIASYLGISLETLSRIGYKKI